MRQQNQQVQQVRQPEWPEVIYLTPDTWGDETFALTREELQETVRSLQGLGEDWQGVSEDDATPYHLHEVRGDYAIYERRVRGGTDRIRVWRLGTGYNWKQV